MTIPRSVGAQSPINIACISSPRKNIYSDTAIISPHKASINMLDKPNFFM